jgi:hypothetical protein
LFDSNKDKEGEKEQDRLNLSSANFRNDKMFNPRWRLEHANSDPEIL